MAKQKKRIFDTNGVEYECGEVLGSGGQGTVRCVTNVQTGKEYALKMYKGDDGNYQLRKNIEALIASGGIHDNKKNVLSFVILPQAIVEGKNGAFGYIMEKVDLDGYTTMLPSWTKPEKRPSLQAICKIIKNLCSFYKALHLSSGLCYKDLNEGNIYFNWKTGDILIIDNDNIAVSGTVTVKGTPRYMAPEVVTGESSPDSRSDVFSLAVFIYRILIGGFPFEGKYVADYCMKNNMPLDDAMKKLFGKDALYVWHSTDRRNGIEGHNQPVWDNQARSYHGLSPKIQEAFRCTFEKNLSSDRRAERFSAESWYDLFDALEQEVVSCRHGQNGYMFSDSTHCYCCHQRNQVPKPPVQKAPPKAAPQPRSSSAPVAAPSGSPVLTVKIVSAGDNPVIKEIRKHEIYKGSDISRHLAAGNLFSTGYSKSKQLFMIMNISKEPWTIHYADGSVKTCEPGKQVYVKADRVISFMAKKVNLKFIKQVN